MIKVVDLQILFKMTINKCTGPYIDMIITILYWIYYASGSPMAAVP